MDKRQADADIIDIDTRLRRVGSGTTTAKVTADTTAATLKLEPLVEKLIRLKTEITTAKVTANTDEAKLKLDQVDLTLRRIGTITTRPKVTLDGVERADIQLDALALRLRAIGMMNAHPSVTAGGAGGGRGGVLSSLASHAPGFLPLAIGAAVPMALPLAGAALGGAASLLTPTVAGGLGGGLFLKTAASSYKTITGDVTALTAAQKAYTSAVTDKSRAAALAKEQKLWASLSPAQQKATTTMHGLDAEWASFQRKLQPQTFGLLATGADIGTKALHLLLPVTRAAGNEIDSLATKADHALSQPFWHQFFTQFLPGQAHSALKTFGTDLGDGLTGIAHLSEQFAPLGNRLQVDMRRWGAEFDSWTQGQGPAHFVAWVQKEGPVAAHALGGLAHGVEGLAKSLMPIGQIELKALTPVLNFIGKLGDEHPAVLEALGGGLLALAGGLKAIQGVSAVSGVVGALSRLGRGGAGVGVVGAASRLGPELGAAGLGAAGAAEGGVTAASLGAVLAPVILGGITIAAGAYGLSKLKHKSSTVSGQSLVTGLKTAGFSDKATASALQSVDFLKTAEAEARAATNAANLAKAYAGVRHEVLNAIPALHDFRTGLSEMGTVADSVGSHKLTGLTAAAQANRVTLRGQVTALNVYRSGLIAAGQPLDVVRAKYDQQALALIKGADATYKNKTAVDALLVRLGLFPKSVVTHIRADTAAAKRALAELQKQKDALAARTVIAISVDTTGKFQTHLPRPAPGGPISPTPKKHHAGSPSLQSNTHLTVVGPRAHGRSIAPRHLPGWLTSQGSTSPNTPISTSTSSSSSSSGSGSSSSSHTTASSAAAARAAARAAAAHRLASSNAAAAIVSYAGLTFTSELEGTTKQVHAGIVGMIDRLNSAVRNKYLTSDKTLVQQLHRAYGPLRSLAAARVSNAAALTAAQSRLGTLRGNASSVRSGTLSAFQSLGDISQMPNVTTVGGILSVLGKQDKVGAAFKKNLATLRKKGLTKKEYDELEQAGPAAAGNIVALLATATKGQIGSINKDTNLLTSLGISTGKASADYVYGSRIKDAQHDVTVLRHEQHDLVVDQRKLVKSLDAFIKAGLQDKGTHSALATLHSDIAETNRLLKQVAGAPSKANVNRQAHVAGVHR